MKNFKANIKRTILHNVACNQQWTMLTKMIVITIIVSGNNGGSVAADVGAADAYEQF